MELEKLLTTYLDSNPIISDNDRVKEFEIRFGTNYREARPITQIDYDNVAKHLLACGFHIQSEAHMLRITNEYVDRNTGETRMSNIRCEIEGENIIKQYCRTNSIQTILDGGSGSQVKFVQKGAYRDENGEPVRYANVPDYNMRAAFQTELTLRNGSGVVQNIVRSWADTKKTFRLINRTRFVHDVFPIYADISIVKSSAKKGRDYIRAYTMEEARVFKSSPGYEIELELNNGRVGSGTPYDEPSVLLATIKKVVRAVIGGMQQTKYPIPYSEHDAVLEQYMKMAHNDTRPPQTRHFIGPGSTTLQIENIVEHTGKVNTPNVRDNYCVTDKADGERRILFVNEAGRIYMISTNMKAIFTGAITINKKLFHSLIDGEYIRTKNGSYIFAAFDIYFVNEKDVRNIPFLDTDPENTETRLVYMQYFIDALRPVSVLIEKNKNRPSPIRIVAKNFAATSETTSIFACCAKILSDMTDGLYEYETDGLIFTPSRMAVGANAPGGGASRMKRTWEYSFKWKPPQFNTIDFLVTAKKDAAGQDEVHHQYQDGVNNSDSSLLKYRTMILRCGYDESKDGIANPCETVLRGEARQTPEYEGRNYKPVPFVPTTPYQMDAYLCNVALNDRDDMMTLEGEPFDDNMIVEFQYDLTKSSGWNWVPLRVRYDKTAELHNTGRNFGNAYFVANGNWKSIHNPVTEQMLRTGMDIPDESVSADIYYNNVSITESKTRCLRDFHNLVVKRKLIQGALRGGTLIDYSVGKAGDLPKWLYANANFVYGIDISPDNIHNKDNGACVRYIKKARQTPRIFDAIFSVGDTGKNILRGEAFETDKDKAVNDAIFGRGAREGLGKGVASIYGVAAKGFDVGSCQFSMHYFFNDKKTLHSFVRNVSETIRVDGHFVGTCYDGNEVFRMLSSMDQGESVMLFREGTKIFEIVKRYSETGFPNDETGLEYGIDVYQETINQYFREYLVNFSYFTQVMEDYGFNVISDEEAVAMDLPRGSGLFSDLFKEKDVNGTGCASKMSKEEKQISFLNRYFVFKKVRDVDAAIVMRSAMTTEDPEIVVKVQEEEAKPKPRKTNKTTVIA